MAMFVSASFFYYFFIFVLILLTKTPHYGFRVVEDGKSRKKSYSKLEMFQMAQDLDIVPKEDNLASYTKTELTCLLGDHLDTSSTSGQVSQVKQKDHTLSPIAMTSTADGILVIDGVTNSVWRVLINKKGSSRVTTSTLIFNLPAECSPKAVAQKGPDKVFVSSNNGLYQHDIGSDICRLRISCKTLECVCANNSTVIVTDSRGLVFRVEADELCLLSGIAQEGVDTVSSVDGFSANAKHAQPGPACLEGNTVYVCDRASKSVRLLTSVDPLLSYHKSISQLYNAFNVHGDTSPSKKEMTLLQSTTMIEQICVQLDVIVSGVRLAANNPDLKPNGNHGSVPFGTVEMFHELSQNMKSVNTDIISINKDYNISPSSMLSTPVEHHFSTMRSRYQMPSVLQYCEHLATVTHEDLKRATTTSFIYFTSKKSFYPVPSLQAIVYRPRQPNSGRLKKHKKRITEDERKLMYNWRKDFCAGKFVVEIAAFSHFSYDALYTGPAANCIVLIPNINLVQCMCIAGGKPCKSLLH